MDKVIYHKSTKVCLLKIIIDIRKQQKLKLKIRNNLIKLQINPTGLLYILFSQHWSHNDSCDCVWKWETEG